MATAFSNDDDKLLEQQNIELNERFENFLRNDQIMLEAIAGSLTECPRYLLVAPSRTVYCMYVNELMVVPNESVKFILGYKLANVARSHRVVIEASETFKLTFPDVQCYTTWASVGHTLTWHIWNTSGLVLRLSGFQWCNVEIHHKYKGPSFRRPVQMVINGRDDEEQQNGRRTFTTLTPMTRKEQRIWVSRS